MKTVKDVLHQLTDPWGILNALRETLREIDPEFSAVEEKYQTAAKALENELGNTSSPSVSAYLSAREAEFVAEVIYIGWQGFQFNADVFHNPINAMMLQGDYEDLHRERRLSTLPAAKGPREIQEAFHAELQKYPEEVQALTEEITGFYSYLEMVGYKLVHYFGFRLADGFLPYILPGYISDPVVTMQYADQLQRYLQIDLRQIE